MTSGILFDQPTAYVFQQTSASNRHDVVGALRGIDHYDYAAGYAIIPLVNQIASVSGATPSIVAGHGGHFDVRDTRFARYFDHLAAARNETFARRTPSRSADAVCAVHLFTMAAARTMHIAMRQLAYATGGATDRTDQLATGRAV